MFERFTERARLVVVLAQDASREMNHSYIGTEHLLLGLAAEGDGIAARVLSSLGLGEEVVKADIIRIVGKGGETHEGNYPFTSRAKKVQRRALREALSFGHNYVGTEHLLLGMVREDEGVAARILLDHDAGPEKIRGAVMDALARRKPQPKPRVVVGINYDELGNLIGRLLTLNDATMADQVQREAQKSIIKQTCKDWLEDVADAQGVEGWT